MSISEEILKLQSLRQSGLLNDAEFEAAKAKLLGSGPPPVPAYADPQPPLYAAPDYTSPGYAATGYAAAPPVPSAAEQNQWAMFLHLSVLAGYLAPLAGLVAPILIWQLKKKQMPLLDAHGCNAANWVISFVIYAIVASILAIVLIGIPVLIALGVLGIVFPVIAAIRANEGIVWRYPLTITFFTPAVTE